MPSSRTLEPKRWQRPPLSTENRRIGGVAAALAREVGVQPIVIRVAFAFLTVVGGSGVVIYGCLWVFLAQSTDSRTGPYTPVPKASSPIRRHLGIGLITLGTALAVNQLGFGFAPQLLLPIGLVFVGLLVAWSREGEQGGISTIIRLLFGLALGSAGVGAAIFMSVSVFDALRLLGVAVAIVGGMILIIAPSAIRIGRDFDEERQERVRADERAEMAAHLHDSVLQTLTLIQRHADDPHRAAVLARQQERDLRQWLYGKDQAQPGLTRLETALQEAAARVEERHDVRVEIVAVGDTEDLNPQAIAGLVAAAQEAMTNAARHADVATIDVYAERRDQTIEVFVRDAGRGFDTSAVDEDRHGIRSSIVERMRREGGHAVINSEPGAGTEVELVLPLPTTDVPPDSHTMMRDTQ